MRVVRKKDIYYCWKIDFNEPIPKWLYTNFRIHVDYMATGIGFIGEQLLYIRKKDDEFARGYKEGEYIISKDLKTIETVKNIYPDFELDNQYEVIEK